jgi:RHS repeat-associated protein
MQVESGAMAGNYYYSRDHLGSICEMTDSGGNVRTQYSYDPFGRRTRMAGDIDGDFGYAGMLWTSEASFNLTRYRAYDVSLGRWISRDPLNNAELEEGHNLYCYVHNDPVNLLDPLGLCCENELQQLMNAIDDAEKAIKKINDELSWICEGGGVGAGVFGIAGKILKNVVQVAQASRYGTYLGTLCAATLVAKTAVSLDWALTIHSFMDKYEECMEEPCWSCRQNLS